jgi:hypothetical protein
MTPEDGQHPNEDLLTTLPNEILTLIAQLLPARQICRLRAQNRHLRSFVNTNQRLLVKAAINHHRNRIHAEHRLLTDLADCEVFDSFLRYYSHYGNAGAPDKTDSSFLKTGAITRTLRNELRKSKGTGQTILTSMMMYFFSRFHSATQDEHIHWRFCMNEMAAGATSPSLTRSELEVLHRKLESARVAGCATPYPVIPLVFLTKRVAESHITFNEEHLSGRDTHHAQDSLFHKKLGLPLLDTDGSLAFCSEDVRTVASLQMLASLGSTMIMLRKADILENIYIW